MEEEVECEVSAEEEEVCDEAPVLMSADDERQREVQRVGAEQFQRARGSRQQRASHIRASDDREVANPLLERRHDEHSTQRRVARSDGQEAREARDERKGSVAKAGRLMRVELGWSTVDGSSQHCGVQPRSRRHRRDVERLFYKL